MYHRDKVSYIYLPKYTDEEIQILCTSLSKNFGLTPRVKIKKTGSIVLSFSVNETKKLHSLIKTYIIPVFHYKLLDPVSTEA